jgi:hypothetical protein
MANSESPRFVQLQGGPILPIEPCVLALDLEARGFRMTKEPDDVLSVQPWQKLTAEDVAAIWRWKLHLLALLDYVPPGPEALQ